MCNETKKATDLLHLLKMTKKEEMSQFVNKLLDLRSVWMQDPTSSLKHLRYKMALERYERMQKDSVDLSHLEQKIEELSNNSVHSWAESA